MSTTLTKKIKSAVDATIPAADDYRIFSAPTGFDDMVVVRVITPAWAKLGKAERIAKVQNAVMPKLSASEQAKIFRFSVLTPTEWNGIRNSFGAVRSSLIGRRTLRSIAS